MQHNGTLLKRQRRNLAKVYGLTIISYNANENGLNTVKDFSSSKELTVLNIASSEFAALRKKTGGIPSSRTRPTRNPNYFNPEAVLEIEKDENPSTFASSDKIDEKEGSGSIIDKKDRLYLFDKFTMSVLRKILLLGLTSGAIPWNWDNTNCKIDKFSPKFYKFWQIFRNIFLFQTACLSIFQIYTFWALATSGKFTNTEIFVSSFSLTRYLYWIDFAINMYKHEDQIREYVNTLFKFNHEMVNKYVINLNGYNHNCRLLTNFSILATLNNTFWCIILFIQMPSAPWYLFSYIYPKPWYWLIPGSIQTYCLLGQMLTAHTLGIWMIVAHTSTIQFWLCEAHNNNQSEYTCDEIRKRKTSFEVFKSLEVLNGLFNECMAPLFIPILKIHELSVAVLCGYIWIRTMNSLFSQTISQFVMHLMGFLVCVVQAFVTLNMSAQMYDLGISFLDSWSLTSDKDFRKTVMSCSTPKVHVRKFYFITVSTTITFFQVVSDLIIDAIMSF